jgi:hypothetical protein
MAQSSAAATVIRRPQPIVEKLRIPVSVSKRERFMGTTIGDKELEMLCELIRYDGLQDIAKAIGISELTLLRVCSGFMGNCRPKSQHAVRKFFALSANEK